ncbi:MAG: TatD family hydrolase [Clostridiales Family XIII bacterium]|jgi:TatD DNase family protein|nr:TatD family hydrolase [Clostridiales Family XIII bacterium]
MLFDSHAHINSEGLTAEGRKELIRRIEDSDLAYVADIGCDMPSSRLAVADAHVSEKIFATVGIHPHEAATATDEALRELATLAEDPRVVAIGEIGLDYFRDLSPRETQRDAFRRQLRLAMKLAMPITIHDRDSGGDMKEILMDEGIFSDERKGRFAPNPETGEKDARLLMHCFSGSLEQALDYIGLGATISIAGPVTFKNNKKTVRVAAGIPLGHMLIETDSPYLTPEPFRGTENVPMNVRYVAEKIAEARGASYEEVASATLENARRFYGI